MAQVPASPEILLSEKRFHKEYVWVPGDQIEVSVRRVPEVSRTVTVRPDGFITLPLINDVKAAGLTPTELRESLTSAFSARLVSPEVTVIATQVPPPVVYVIGEVGNNMAVPLRNARTISAAIAAAGGFRRSAKTGDTTIIRLGTDGYIRSIPVHNVAGGQPGAVMGMRDVFLEADDIVFVPESGRSQVARFVDDFINRPLGTLGGALGVYVNVRWIQTLP
ncbi:MAG TPA: polysaccharide biosynthesis/export family protein [Terriglobales bacterium]|nr:polysaccharide biosynthesis/export family protein [Terriglobales bacterium]